MTQTLNATCQIRQLDSGYSKETRALLYEAYMHDPTFRYVFEAHRKGYAQRVRATVRALVKQHFFQQLPALGLLVDDRLMVLKVAARTAQARRQHHAQLPRPTLSNAQAPLRRSNQGNTDQTVIDQQPQGG